RLTNRSTTPASTERATNTTASAITPLPKPAPSESPTSKLQEFSAKLNAAADAKSARPQLAELRATLAAMSTNAAVAGIRQILDSKVDASTHLGFKVASNGTLDEAPTLRTFLL